MSIFLSLLSGFILSSAFPRLDLGVMAWVGLIPLFFALEGRSSWASFRLGLTAGLAFYLGLLYWILVPLTVYGQVPYHFAIPTLLLLVIYLSLYFGAFALIYDRLKGLGSFPPFISIPSAWVALELIRTYLLTGFPWGALGYSQYRNLWLIQISDVTGVYGVSFLLVLVNFALYQVARGAFKGEWGRAIRSPALATTCLILFGVGLYGWNRLSYWDKVVPRRTLSVGIAQGNIDQGVKWDASFRRETVLIYDRLSRALSPTSPELVIWPETAAPFPIQVDAELTPLLIEVAQREGSYLLLGAPGLKLEKGGIRFTNSAFLFSPDGQVLGRYDKIHLVPFGEYTPLKFLFPFLKTVSALGPGEFSPGEGLTIFGLPKGRFATIICYEAIFPGLVRRFVKGGADFLVNITNDAWFGRTSAPYQHFSMAIFRAVENRVYLARAAQTGISALVSWKGEVLVESEIFTEDIINGWIPMKEEATIYTRFGDTFAYLLTALSLWGLLQSFIERRYHA